MQKLISVIIPVRNVEKTIKTCLSSIFNQTVKDFEIIMVESGSTDKTVEICQEFANSYDSIKFFSTTEPGVSRARNIALDNAVGKYIYFLDADDTINFNVFEILLNFSNATGSEVVGSLKAEYLMTSSETIKYSHPDCVFKYLDRVLVKDDILGLLSQLISLSCGSTNKLVLRSVIEENNIRFPLWTGHGEDYVFNADLFTKCNRAYFGSQELYTYNFNVDGTSNARLTYYKHLNEWTLVLKYIIEKFLNFENDVCSLELKKAAFTNISSFILDVFVNARLNDFTARIMTEQMDYCKPYILWGAGYMCKIYLKREERFENLIIVDSDKSKQGTQLLGYKVIAPEEIKNYYTEDTDFIITTKYFFEVFNQLKKLNFVKGLGDAMINKGAAKWQQHYINALKPLYEDVYCNPKYSFLFE